MTDLATVMTRAVSLAPEPPALVLLAAGVIAMGIGLLRKRGGVAAKRH